MESLRERERQREELPVLPFGESIHFIDRLGCLGPILSGAGIWVVRPA